MWRFATALAVGTSHVKAMLPCQDRLACEVLSDGSLVAAIADGAGSAQYSERGAEIIVNATIDSLKCGIAARRTDFDELLRESAAIARETLSAYAGEKGEPLRSYASTLLAVVLTPAGGGALQIGDGVIVVNDGPTNWCWVFWPQRGEYANTTHFLTDSEALNKVEVELFLGSVTDVALMSDGLEALALHYQSNAVFEPFFRGMFRPLHEASGWAEIEKLSADLAHFLSSDQIGSRTDDDVSLILATRRAHPSSE